MQDKDALWRPSLGDTLREEDLKKVLRRAAFGTKNLSSRVTEIRKLVGMPNDPKKEFLERRPKGRPRKEGREDQ